MSRFKFLGYHKACWSVIDCKLHKATDWNIKIKATNSNISDVTVK